MTGHTGDRMRVLVVEDEPLIAMLIESMLEDAGCEVVATAPNLKTGLVEAQKENLDLAILDMTLGQDSSFAIADILDDRGVPFLFASGYDGQLLPAKHSARHVLAKPFTLLDLEKKLEAVRFG